MGTNSQDFRIGEDTDYDSTPMGAIDEVRLWNVARSGSEIAATMNTTITTARTGLVGAWNMEGDGADAVGGHGGVTHGDIEFSATPLESETPTPSPSPTDTPSSFPTPSPTPSPTPNPSAFLKGDLDCNHVVDASDLLVYLKYKAGIAGRPPVGCDAQPVAVPGGGGPFGQFLNFSAPDSGYVSVPDSPELNPTNAITVETWVYLSSYATQNDYNNCPSLVGKGYVTSYWLGVCDGYVHFYPYDSDNDYESNSTVPLRQWTHVAVVADLTTVTLYINGVQDAQNTGISGSFSANTNPVEIGSDADYDFRPFGALDEVQIWNVAHSQADIQSTMNAPVTPPQTGLVAVYHFDGDLTDATGSHDGAAAGSVTLNDVTPPTDWSDLDCDGYTDSTGDWLAVLYHAAGLTYTLPPGCGALGTPES